MMVKFFVQRVINGKTKFIDVPDALKEEVRCILINDGFGNLCVSYIPN